MMEPKAGDANDVQITAWLFTKAYQSMKQKQTQHKCPLVDTRCVQQDKTTTSFNSSQKRAEKSIRTEQ